MQVGTVHRQIVMPALLSWLALLVVSCQTSSPTGPSSSDLLSRFIESLRQQGLTVTLAPDPPRLANPFFSVPAKQVVANDGRVTMFEYPTAEAAAREATVVSPNGQPTPSAIIEWVSTPRFYQRDRLIALYVGCSPAIVRALDTTMGSAFVVGRVPCSRAD